MIATIADLAKARPGDACFDMHDGLPDIDPLGVAEITHARVGRPLLARALTSGPLVPFVENKVAYLIDSSPLDTGVMLYTLGYFYDGAAYILSIEVDPT